MKIQRGSCIEVSVIAVNNKELIVNCGTEYTGYISLSDYTNDYSKPLTKLVSVGDKIDAIIISINDSDKTIRLKKKCDTDFQNLSLEGSVKEICDVVTAEVMKQVRQNLSEIKPQISDEIVKRTSKIVLNQVESRIKELENKITKLSSQPLKTEKSNCNKLSKAEVDNILSLPDFYEEAGEWIFYIKIEKYNYRRLYKMRIDGSENQRVFDGYVANSRGIYKDGNYLFFYETMNPGLNDNIMYLTERKIKIN